MVTGEVVRVHSLVSIAFVLQEIADNFVVFRPDIGVVKVWRRGGGDGGGGCGGLPVTPLVLAGPRHLVWRRVARGGGVRPSLRLVTRGRDLVNLVLVEPVVDVVVAREDPLRHLAVRLLRGPLPLTGPDGKVISRWRSWNLGPDGHVLSLTQRHKHRVDAAFVAR